MSDARTQNSTAVHRFAILTSGVTVVLLMAGALVTSNDAADSVPDWPLAYGKIIPPLVGGIRYEFAHRVVAGAVAVLTLILAVWLARTENRRSVRRLGWTALALVVVQALLGALRVLLGHPPIVATIHATVAQIFFITTVALAIMGVVDYGMNIQEAVNASRFHNQWMPDVLSVEGWFAPDAVHALEKMGYKIIIGQHEDASWSPYWSDAECIAIDPQTAERLGASDGRNSGKPVGY